MSKGLLDPKVDFVFKNIFGSREDFNLNDIYKIEFRNRIVYEDKSIDFDNIETKEEEISI